MRVFVTGATEADPLDWRSIPGAVQMPAAITYVDKTVPLEAPEGIVLRYGSFYGPGASDVFLDMPRKRQLPVIGGGTGIWSFIEVTDAAAATLAAVNCGAPGSTTSWTVTRRDGRRRKVRGIPAAPQGPGKRSGGPPAGQTTQHR